jgi:hypothetical protein
MREIAKVHSSFWTSPNINRLSEDGRMLAFYLLTCPHGNSLGAYRLPEGYVAEDLKWDSDRVKRTFKELEGTVSEPLIKGLGLASEPFALRCETVGWVWIFHHLKWNKPDNPNQFKSLVKLACKIPDNCGWKPLFMRVYGEQLGLAFEPFGKGSQMVDESILNGLITIPNVRAHDLSSFKDPKDKDKNKDQRSSSPAKKPGGHIAPAGLAGAQTGEGTIGHKASREAKPQTVTIADLVAQGVQRQHAEDWFVARKGKGAKHLTVTAWNGVIREAKLAGISLDKAVAFSAENCWQGFKADWYQRDKQGQRPHGSNKPAIPTPGTGQYGEGGEL